MTNDTKTKIGHNSNTEYREGGAMIDTIGFLHSALDDAITLIISQTKRNTKVEKHLKSAVFAKNNLQRGVHLSKATAQVCKNKAEVENFDNVITVINNREDIHSGLGKSHKLNLCAQTGNFGDYIANCVGGKAIENVVDSALIKADREGDLDE
jgi:hypothetical protein